MMADPATDLRDPIFFRLHAFIDEMFQDYKATIPRYTRGLVSFLFVEKYLYLKFSAL